MNVPKSGERRGTGVIHLGLLNIIRRMHLRQKLSICEIAPLMGVSRETVTKHHQSKICDAAAVKQYYLS